MYHLTLQISDLSTLKIVCASSFILVSISINRSVDKWIDIYTQIDTQMYVYISCIQEIDVDAHIKTHIPFTGSVSLENPD